MGSTISKAIIPVAGLGTRVLPASKVIPKEMMPVVDKPVIQYVVEEAISAGITEIIFVTRSGKATIEEHFYSHYELESVLERNSKLSALKAVKNILPAGVTITSVRQDHPLGLGHAIYCAAAVTGSDDFAVLLPDMLVNNYPQKQTDLSLMTKKYEDSGIGQIMVEPVPMDLVDRYGIVNCNGIDFSSGESCAINSVVEKPPVESAPSNLSINGRYILPSRIMELLKETQPGAGGEIQLTDAIDQYLKEGALHAFRMSGKTYDCGSKTGYIQANIAYGLQHPETASGLKAYLREINHSA